MVQNGEETTKTFPYILQLINSARFKVSSLLNLVDNLAEEIHKTKLKYAHDNYELNCEDCEL